MLRYAFENIYKKVVNYYYVLFLSAFYFTVTINYDKIAWKKEIDDETADYL